MDARLSPFPTLQRARGEGRVVVRAQSGTTRLHRLYQDGCAKIRLPRDADARGLEAVLINTSGGLTGGDRMAWRAEAGEDCRLTITTQACEKVYRALDAPAESRVALQADAGAVIHWLPQETILFDNGGLSRRLEADLAADAELLAMEAVILGRTAMGETVRAGTLKDRWRIRRDGGLIFADDVRMAGPLAEVGALAPILAGARAFASILLCAPDAERFLSPLRAILGETGGATAFDGKLFCRLTAPDGFTLRKTLIPALAILRDGSALPKVWRT